MIRRNYGRSGLQECHTNVNGRLIWGGVVSEKCVGGCALNHAVLLRTFLNLEIADHLTNVSDLYCLGFRERWVNQAPVLYASKVVCHPNSMARGTFGQHALNIGEVSRCRHLKQLVYRL
jgi:hypothetical protein